MHKNLTCFFHDGFEIYYITLGTQDMPKHYLNDTFYLHKVSVISKANKLNAHVYSQGRTDSTTEATFSSIDCTKYLYQLAKECGVSETNKV